MQYTIRALTPDDEPILWTMLCHAAHEDAIETVRNQPLLARYVQGWGREGDLGCVALFGDRAISAAWVRLWRDAELPGFGYVDATIPELAIATLPDYRGQGIGTQLIQQILVMSQPCFPGVSLNVRADNPAVRLYERLGFVKVPGSEIVNRTGGISFNMLYLFQQSVQI